ncbi:MAG: PKD domain-containing protein, partial [Candidatus Atribacteria bacterium]|nr:PKD domain-containing protein [Candidatus Atribacteria bacterium]
MILKRHILIRIILIAFMIVSFSIPGFSYNNDNRSRTMEGGPHRTINYYAIQLFLSKSRNDPIFNKYDFTNGSDLSGITIIKPGDWKEDIISGEREGKWYQWVIEGGYTADEPERYMSLRHFYDPLGANQGANYLTDHVDEFLTSIVMGTNPKMDAKWWGALHSPYSIEKGKEFMTLAFSSANLQEKEKLFAAAWRSLGETMHLLADMTVPAHVRNDSHPGVEWTQYITDKYRADPYEEFVDQKVVENCLCSPDPELVEAINKIPKNEDGFLRVLNLFDCVAGYTNRKFFSLDTIAGIEKALGQRITNSNGMPEYPLPRLEDLETDEEGYYYQNDYLGKLYLVRMLYQQKLSLTGKLNLIPKPEIDDKCSLSQAKRLIPAAIYANEQLIEWFIPKIEVIIDSFVLNEAGTAGREGVIKGRIVHIPSGMYDQPLWFTMPTDGMISMKMNGEIFETQPGSISIRNGVIEGKVHSLPPGPIKDMSLLVDIGGIVVSSSDLKIYNLQLHPEKLDGLSKKKYGFYVQSDNPPSWVSYVWNFGDGRVEETDSTSIAHTYESEGEYQIQVQMKDANTGKILATANGKAYISPQEENDIPDTIVSSTPEPTLMIDSVLIEETPPPNRITPAPTPDEEAHRQQVLAEYRSIYPGYLSWFHKIGRVEVIANAEEV